MKILIIEDEPDMRENLKTSLVKDGFTVEEASDFSSAMKKIALYEYDCILLDIMLPGGSGLAILKEIKALEKTDGVIIISAKDSLDDKIKGLDLGADDYLTKPFHIAELNARIKSVLRRKAFDGQQEMELNNLKINLDSRAVTVAGKPLALNRKELDVLLYLAVNKNRLVTKTSLAEHVWGDHFDEEDNYEFIYSQIKNLRKKLKEASAALDIEAVYGIGYKLTLP